MTSLCLNGYRRFVDFWNTSSSTLAKSTTAHVWQSDGDAWLHVTWSWNSYRWHDEFAGQKYHPCMLPWYQFPVEIMGAVYNGRTLHMFCYWSCWRRCSRFVCVCFVVVSWSSSDLMFTHNTAVWDRESIHVLRLRQYPCTETIVSRQYWWPRLRCRQHPESIPVAFQCYCSGIVESISLIRPSIIMYVENL